MSGAVSTELTSRRLKLSRPVQAHGEMITDLVFREPTANDAWECGLPLRFNADAEMIIGTQPMMQLASRLTAVPLSTIKALTLSDLMQVVGIISSFLGTPEQVETAPVPVIDMTSSPEPSTSLGSGRSTPLPFSRSA